MTKPLTIADLFELNQAHPPYTEGNVCWFEGSPDFRYVSNVKVGNMIIIVVKGSAKPLESDSCRKRNSFNLLKTNIPFDDDQHLEVYVQNKSDPISSRDAHPLHSELVTYNVLGEERTVVNFYRTFHPDIVKAVENDTEVLNERL